MAGGSSSLAIKQKHAVFMCFSSSVLDCIWRVDPHSNDWHTYDGLDGRFACRLLAKMIELVELTLLDDWNCGTHSLEMGRKATGSTELLCPNVLY